MNPFSTRPLLRYNPDECPAQQIHPKLWLFRVPPVCKHCGQRHYNYNKCRDRNYYTKPDQFGHPASLQRRPGDSDAVYDGYREDDETHERD